MKHLKFNTFLLTLLLSMAGITAAAHDIAVANKDGKTIYYVWTNNKTALAVSYQGTISNSDFNDYSGNVVIPESVTYNGATYPVTSIGDRAFCYCSGLTSVTIPNSVTSIGQSAFEGCSELTGVNIPDSVTSIGAYAFLDCSGLTSLTISNSVTNLRSEVFAGCSSLTSVTIPNSVTIIDLEALTDSLHRMDIRLMLSVWSKIDKNSEVGRQMQADGHYIPGTDWIDFFKPEAAAAYWKNFSERLVPQGIDAWWQDATEPENDDLVGRRVNGGRWAGEQVRNVYPLLVCKTVSEGLHKGILNGDGEPSFILTRCGFPGIQRYGIALWSGDVGNDWETFRRQIVAGLGMQAAGIPWWTYDAGGFFRPGDQYTNQEYIERMLRWIETSVYLPLMRVHGYMSNTEPWNYGAEAKRIISECLRERYRLLPYIERCAKDVAENGGTLMRPLVFDFTDDKEALLQKYEYMFGPELLICPITESGVATWRVYLPRNAAGWTDTRTNRHYAGGQYVVVPVTLERIPVFKRL